MDQYTRRINGFGAHAGNVDRPALCRMFNDATSGYDWLKHLSSDNDPLFQYHRWKANLRVLEINEIKSLLHVPMSHPFVERLIGSIRRELLDQTLYWTATDLEKSCVNISVITTRAGLILGGVAILQFRQAAKRSLISISTAGRNIVAVYFIYQRRPEFTFRQAQVGRSVLTISDGGIAAMRDEYEDEALVEVGAWMQQYGADLDGSYV